MAGLVYTTNRGDEFTYDRSTALLTVKHGFYADCPPGTEFKIIGRYASTSVAYLHEPDLWWDALPLNTAPTIATYTEVPNPDSSQMEDPYDKWLADHNRRINMQTQYLIPHDWMTFFERSIFVNPNDGTLNDQYYASLRICTVYNDYTGNQKINMTSLESKIRKDYLYVDQWHGEYTKWK